MLKRIAIARLAILFLVGPIAIAENVDTVWVRYYNGPADDIDNCRTMAVDQSNNIYLSGQSIGISTYVDYIIVKFQPNGDTAWTRRYYNIDGIAYDDPFSITVDYQGNLNVTGWSEGSVGDLDYATIKYFSNGDTAWVSRYNGPGNDRDEANVVRTDDAGYVYVTGASIGSGTGRDYTTIKYNSDGDTVWVRRYNGSGNAEDIPWGLGIYNGTYVYISGWSNGGTSGDDLITIKYLPNGDTAWVRTYNGPGGLDDGANKLALDESGNIYVIGESFGVGTNTDFVTIKYLSNGDTAWVRRYDGPGHKADAAWDLCLDKGQNIYVTGPSNGSGTNLDFATIKYKPNGDTAWVRRYAGPGTANDYAVGMTVDELGNVYVTGMAERDGVGYDYYDCVTLKYDSAGNQVWVKTFKGSGNGYDAGYFVAVDSLSNVFVGGEAINATTNCDILLVKYSIVPEVIIITPTANTHNVYTDSPISVTFNTYMDGMSINESSFLVYGNLTGYRTGTISYNQSTYTAMFDPDRNFMPGEMVTVILTEQVESLEGFHIADQYIWSFTAEAGGGIGSFIEPDIISGFITPVSICAGDLNSDGFMDIAVADLDSQALNVFLNDGLGALQLDSTYQTGKLCHYIVTADFNKDGMLDLAVVNRATDNSISVLLNMGNGEFGPLSDYPIGVDPKALTTSDYNGDGYIDIAANNQDSEDISILLNDGSGAFLPDVTFSSAGKTWHIVSGDIDNDGDIDLATTNNHSENISVYFNNGMADFSTRVDYSVPHQPSELIATDLDADGDLDIAVAIGGDMCVAILMNNGDGSLSPYTTYSIGVEATSIRAADINNDGNVDLITGNQNTPYISILINTGDGTFSQPNPILAGEIPSRIIIADLNNDRSLDIISANSTSGNISILKNRVLLWVTSVNCSGAGTLDNALENAATYLGPIDIGFGISGTISLEEPLPVIAKNNTRILGSSAPGGPHSVIIDGLSLSKTAGSCFQIQSSNNKIEGLTICNFPANGIEVTGTTSIKNTFTNNLIYNNGGLAIDLGDEGVTANDPGDIDTGPNDLLNFPVFDSTHYSGKGNYEFFGTAQPNSKIELYVAHSVGDVTRPEDPTGHGEACLFIDSVIAAGDGSFYYNFGLQNDFTVVTATATDNQGNTSEFSENLTLAPGPLIIVAYSPVNLCVTDPVGDSIGLTANGTPFQTIFPASYTETTEGSDSVHIDFPLVGEYIIEVIGEEGAPPGDSLYTIGVRIDGTAECILVMEAFIPPSGMITSYGYIVEEGWHYLNGDCNRDGVVNILDIIYLIDCKFKGGPCPEPPGAGDANCNLTVNIIDIIYLIDYKFKGGPAPCSAD